MVKFVTLFLVFSIFSFLFAQSMWINEFHYDNVSTDEGEFIEVAIPGDTTGITVTLYNGNNGTVYDELDLGKFTEGVTINGITLYFISLPSNGIQNGAPDGIALDDNGVLVQFLSYEGTFDGIGGPADGITSVDIGVSESNSTTAIGESLQLLGTGTDYTDFTWSGPFAETPGATNSDGLGGDQQLPVELVSFSAISGDGFVNLKWKTASEVDNQGFIIFRSLAEEGQYELLDSYESNDALKGAGNSSQERSYTYLDKNLFNGTTYWYKLADVDLNGVLTEHGPIYATPSVNVINDNNADVPESFALFQNKPNPFNPSTKIQVNVPATNGGPTEITFEVFNITGQRVATLHRGAIDPGVKTFTWHAADYLPSGVYIYVLTSESFTAAKRMVLLK